MEARMKKALEDLHTDLSSLRTGRASPTILDKVMVEYFGALTPLKTMANVTVPDARQLLVTPYDRKSAGAIANAISRSDIGLSANVDGNTVRVAVPTLNTERRQEMVKLAGKRSEEHKVTVRNIRQDANKQFERLEKEGEMSKDDLSRFKGEVQKITDRYIADIEQICTAKEADIMEN
jgi:ribosome recycling factor